MKSIKPAIYKGHKVTFQNKFGYVAIKNVSGKFGKKMIAYDLKRGGWHFGRFYGGKRHAMRVIKPVINYWMREGK